MYAFERTYIVQNTVSLKNDHLKQSLERTHNILLPESAFNELLANQCEFPFTFNISNYNDNTQKTHVGVQEFSANDGSIMIPNILMERLSYPNTIRVKYIQLPSVQSIELQPHNSSFLKQKNNEMCIRTTLGDLSCLSIDDTINVIIDGNTYKLNVTNLTPSIFNGVSLSDKQFTLEINFTDPIVIDEEDINDENCPIESNVNATNGNDNNIDDDDDDEEDEYDLIIDNNNQTVDGSNNNNNNNNNNNTLGGGEDLNNDTDEGFSDDDLSNNGWGDSDEIGSYSDFDGQDQIPIRNEEFTPPPNYDDIQYVPDPNSTHDGNSRPIKPITTKIDYRAWICEFCHAINNLLDSIKRDYKCIQCVGKYKPGQTIIESKEQDKSMEEKTKFTVWICRCSTFNATEWETCDMCASNKPKEGLITIITDEQPIPRVKPQIPQSPKRDDKEDINVGDLGGNGLWKCLKCNWDNSQYASYCQGCNKSHFGANYKVNKGLLGDNKVNKGDVYRQYHYGNVSSLGDTKTISTYPIVSKEHSINRRLVKIFGNAYRNSLLVDVFLDIEQNKNKWINKTLGHGFIDMCDKYLELKPFTHLAASGSKSMAINEKNGYIACIINGFIIIFAPIGCNKFNLLAYTHHDSSSGKNSLSRIRFINNDIYVLDKNSYKIFHYKFFPLTNNILMQKEIFDEYFMEANVVDFTVTDELLMVLFDRWFGVYKLTAMHIEWYHAIAYSKSDNTKASSIEMCNYDDLEIEINKDKKKDQEEEEKKGYEDKLYPSKMDYKPSIKNFIFVNCNNNIIAIHPTNPTFDFLYVGYNVKNGSSFCNSKQYGTFWINNEQDMITQSHLYNHSLINTIFSLEKGFVFDRFQMIPMNKNKNEFAVENIATLNNVLYDEGYGISGRLLINCTVKYNEKEVSTFYQLFNHNELFPLKQFLENNDYFLMPGTDLKPFTLIVYVYEMLYGSDLIDSLIQSPDFNSVYALPGKQENDKENKEEKEEEKEEEEIIENVNKFLKVESRCLIYVNNRWFNGIVAKILPIDENNKEYLEILYINEEKETKKITFDRYDKLLKYNESISLNDIKTIHKNIKWEIGDKCLYFDEGAEEWYSAEIIEINEAFDGEKYITKKIITVGYEFGQKIIDYNDINLHKLDDVVKENKLKSDEIQNESEEDMDLEQDEGDKVAMMPIGAEGPLDQSYVAIKAIGKEKAEMDQDLVFVDDVEDDNMEIEHEGVNEIALN